MNAELNALKDALDGQRDHVLELLDGLSEQDLRRPALSTVTWLGETSTQATPHGAARISQEDCP